MSDDLYDRYLAAGRRVTDHQQNCPVCRAEQRCEAGDRLWKLFSRLQDAYLKDRKR
ncbi:hypothetical protein [Streptomyces albipurpureus]|uniref:Zinc-finger domain-containing protein n=1 Tax=Streptomyces albipurpureus TaxID=2897419 RepID=A0ABT0V0Y2_9ACTN|nr:hypothetical protein [Streptomyces sp. CWNU-1]MCM2394396.1 hypothetical protein [Streptomyces sp. CWNU-1]